MQLSVISTATFSSISRLKFSDLNEDRVRSFQAAIDRFCKRSESPSNPMSVWALVQSVVTGRAPGELWALFSGDNIQAYFINDVRQDLDGKWTLFILHAWMSPSNPISENRKQFDVVIDDAFRRGVSRVQFLTRRNSKAFDRLIDHKFKAVGVLFEREQ